MQFPNFLSVASSDEAFRAFEVGTSRLDELYFGLLSNQNDLSGLLMG